MQIQSRFFIEVWQLQTCEKFKVHHCFHLGSTLTTSTLVCQKFDVQLFPTQYIDFPFLKSWRHSQIYFQRVSSWISRMILSKKICWISRIKRCGQVSPLKKPMVAWKMFQVSPCPMLLADETSGFPKFPPKQKRQRVQRGDSPAYPSPEVGILQKMPFSQEVVTVGWCLMAIYTWDLTEKKRYPDVW